MNFSEEKLIGRYRRIDLDPSYSLQKETYQRICAKKSSFKRQTVWRLSAAAAAVLLALAVWMRLGEPAYYPNPGDFDRMNFAFYRELACPGQDLGISFDDFPSAPF